MIFILRGSDYRNISTSTASGAMPNKTIYVGANNPLAANYLCATSKKISLAFIGKGLSSANADSLFECVQNFNTTLNRYVGVPSYTSFDSDAQAFITAAGLTNYFDKVAANYLVTELKISSIWTKMRGLYPFLGSSTSSMSYNLKDTANYNLTLVGSGITANTEGLEIVQGASFNYADTNISDSILNATNTHLSCWFKNNDPNNYYMGLYSLTTSNGTFLGTNGAGIFQGNGYLGALQSTGLILGQKPSSGTSEWYLRGALIQTTSNTDTAANNLNLYIGGLNDYGTNNQSGGRVTGVFRFCSIGNGFTSGENSTYYTIIKTVMRSLGRSSN